MSPAEKKLQRLPKWAQARILNAESKAQRLEALLPWHENAMEWFVVNGYSDQTNLFTLSSGGANRICALYKGDKLFIGRAKR